MFLATSDPARQLVLISFIGRVSAKEVIATRENLAQLLKEMKPGFRLLSDLTLLESFDEDSPPEIGKNMKLFSEKGIGMVVRVIPDATKDFGLNILSFFHYAHHPQTITCETMTQAIKALEL